MLFCFLRLLCMIWWETYEETSNRSILRFYKNAPTLSFSLSLFLYECNLSQKISAYQAKIVKLMFYFMGPTGEKVPRISKQMTHKGCCRKCSFMTYKKERENEATKKTMLYIEVDLIIIRLFVGVLGSSLVWLIDNKNTEARSGRNEKCLALLNCPMENCERHYFLFFFLSLTSDENTQQKKMCMPCIMNLKSFVHAYTRACVCIFDGASINPCNTSNEYTSIFVVFK